MTWETAQSIDGDNSNKNTGIDEGINDWNHTCSKYHESQCKNGCIGHTLTNQFL